MARPPRRRTAKELARFFKKGGCVRFQNEARLREGSQSYKKGDEVRIMADSQEDLHSIRALLMDAGFVPGRPFIKGRRFCQPVYGREAVTRFLVLITSGGSK